MLVVRVKAVVILLLLTVLNGAMMSSVVNLKTDRVLFRAGATERLLKALTESALLNCSAD